MRTWNLFVISVLAYLVVYIARTIAIEFIPVGLIFSGAIEAVFIDESRLKGFTKKAILYDFFFCIFFGFWVAVIIRDKAVAPEGMFVASSLLAIPFNLFGLFLGMVVRGFTERLEKDLPNDT
jgi:hypothetical protein